MSDANDHPQEPQPKKTPTLQLDKLMPSKTPVNTSIGILYVRYMRRADWKLLTAEDPIALGMDALKQLCSRIEDKHDRTALEDEEMRKLTNEDFLAIVPAISKQNDWEESPAGAGLAELGALVTAARARKIEADKKMFESIRKSIDLNYAFLQGDTLKKLQDQIAGLADIRSSLNETRIETLKFPVLPRPEDSPLGRATLENAQNSRQLAQKMDDLVVVVTGLNQTLIQEVLPAWLNKIAEDQIAAKRALIHAASGLQWTKWTMIVSVFVAALATGWQVHVAQDIDRGNTELQNQTKAILREQLTIQQKQIDQQTRDAQAMRETISALQSSVIKASEQLSGSPRKTRR